jgi:3-oxoacyl-[acyl-carrier protein] reductase
MSSTFEGQVAVVTGAGAGMGAAIAKELAARGAAVAAVDVALPAAERTVAAVREAGGTAIAIRTDISDRAQVEAMAAKVRDELGAASILVNNAGILDDYAPVGDASYELWDRIIGVNLTGTFNVTKALLDQLLSHDDSAVVNIGSIASFVAGGGGAAYTSSKHAVLGFTRQLSHDYGPKGLRANAVCPGAVETEMTKDILNSDLPVVQVVRSVPAGRHGQPEEIAKLVAFLASTDSSFIHGQPVLIDGGWTVR